MMITNCEFPPSRSKTDTTPQRSQYSFSHAARQTHFLISILSALKKASIYMRNCLIRQSVQQNIMIRMFRENGLTSDLQRSLQNLDPYNDTIQLMYVLYSSKMLFRIICYLPYVTCFEMKTLLWRPLSL